MEPSLSHMTEITPDFLVDKEKFLGKGANGEVFEGYCLSRKCKTAVKVMPACHIDEDRQIQVMKEISKLKHKYVMSYFGCAVKEGSLYIFVQHCPGGSFQKVVSNGVSQEQAFIYMRQIVEGMCYLNSEKIIHRDLKPDNIFIGKDGDLKIGDFGSAKITDSLGVTSQQGTPIYSAPQVWSFENIPEPYKVDVWSLGAIINQMLTKQLLFPTLKTFQELKKQWRRFEEGQRLIQYGPQLHPYWSYLVNLMLSFNPNRRPFFDEILKIIKRIQPIMFRGFQNGVYDLQSKFAVKVDEALSHQLGKMEIYAKIAQGMIALEEGVQKQMSLAAAILAIGLYLVGCEAVVKGRKLRKVMLSDPKVSITVPQDDDQALITMEMHRSLTQVSQVRWQHKLKHLWVQLQPLLNKAPLDSPKLKETLESIVGLSLIGQEHYRDELKGLVHWRVWLDWILLKPNSATTRLLHLTWLAATYDQEGPKLVEGQKSMATFWAKIDGQSPIEAKNWIKQHYS